MRKEVWQKISFKRTFVQSLVAGVGWGLGASVGVVVLLWILTRALSLVGGLPWVGEFFAEIISATQKALELRQIR